MRKIPLLAWAIGITVAIAIVGLITAIFKLSGTADNSDSSTFGLIFFIALVGLIFGSVLLYKKNDLGKWTVFVSLILLLFTYVDIGWIFDKTPTPGTFDVTEGTYLGEATGDSYTLTDTKWLEFDWPYNTCVRVHPLHKVLSKPMAESGLVKFLSHSEEIQREIRTLQAGETWKGYTC